MTTSGITCRRHLYTSVTARDSLLDVDGLQTIAHSANLTEAEVGELVKRLSFPKNGEDIRRLFFVISSGHFVCTEMRRVSAPDHANRGGVYLAHSIVVDCRELVRLGIGPFAIFGQGPTDLETSDVVAAREDLTGHIDDLQIKAVGYYEHDLNNIALWGADELVKVVALALEAERLQTLRVSTAFCGSPEAVENALRAVLYCVPSQWMDRCSFATLDDGCDSIDTYYWAIGLRKAPNNPKRLVVDARQRRVVHPIERPSHSLYLRFLRTLAEKKRIAEIAAFKDNAFAVSQFVHCDIADHVRLKQTPDELVDFLYQLAELEIDQALLGAIMKQGMPESLARRILEHARRWHGRAVALRGIAGGDWCLAQLCDLLERSFIADECRRPADEERAALKEVLPQIPLRFLHALRCSWERDYDELTRLLAAADRYGYRKLIDEIMAQELEPPERLVVAGPDRERELEAALQKSCPNLQLIKLVDAVIEARRDTTAKGHGRWFWPKRGH